MSSYNIAVFVSGGGSNLQSIIDASKEGEISGKVKLIISNRKDVFALKRAEKHGINSAVLKSTDEQIIPILKENRIDLIVLAGYLSIIPKAIIDEYENRIINIHPSLIPKFSGMGFHGEKVHKAVLEAGEEKTGATVHFVDYGVDTGKIILQSEVPVLKGDDVESLSKRVLETEHKLLVSAIKKLEKEKNYESID